MADPKHQSGTSLIAVQKVTKAFGLRPVLREISFEVAGGAIAALLGPNGSGKTTLLRMLSGLSKPTAGTISIGGWTLPGEAAAVRAQLGVVAHLPLLYDDLSATENLDFYARLYDAPMNQQRLDAVLDRVGLKKRANELVRTFSRGMQQRLALARAMLHDPAVMLLDEPYTGLDAPGADMLDALLAEWKAAGRTILISLHDLERATRLSDQLLMLGKGRLVLNAPPAQIDNLAERFAQAAS